LAGVTGGEVLKVT